MDWLIGCNVKVVEPFTARLTLLTGTVESVSPEGVRFVRAVVSPDSTAKSSDVCDVTVPTGMLAKYIIVELDK